jgi:hypothetical protein
MMRGMPNLETDRAIFRQSPGDASALHGVDLVYWASRGLGYLALLAVTALGVGELFFF